MKKTILVAGIGAAAIALATVAWLARSPTPTSAEPPVAATVTLDTAPALAGLKDLLANYRKVIVLLADEKAIPVNEKAQVSQVGQALFHDNRQREQALVAQLQSWFNAGHPKRLEGLSGLLDYMESDPDLFDADRLAFKELLRSLQGMVAQDSSLPAIKLHKRIGEDLDALAEIERNYDKEIRLIFGRFETRAIDLKRERWDDYVAKLQKRYNREQILKDFGLITPYPESKPIKSTHKSESDGEVFGYALPPKTIVLTFDDGPHAAYTQEIAATLKQYGVPAVFFQVGSNLGTVGADGKPKLSARADISRKLLSEGHALANHSMTHAQLSKRTGDALKAEILGTDALLKAIDARSSSLFRFPYGARSEEGLSLLEAAKLRSVMWNIDSLDWADPLPSSIAARVLAAVEKENRGIVLFHDIHERTVKALPAILDRLVAGGYQFAGWDGSGFSIPKGTNQASAKTFSALASAASAGYGDSWAVVIGIDDYAKWPKLQYAARDAQAIRETLASQFGFSAERIISLDNKAATRAAILSAFNDRLSQSGMKKNDRLFVFFAGHGATRQLSSGRDVGYIIPVDSDPKQLATDAIAMTELQNIAENLTAKHVLFVMDACYSGLGLTRGAGSSNFLRDNAKRIGRQMLTAGGADQLVADGGPNGHSVFTWTLLQGLSGKGDLNGDGLITATELAAYVAPAVAAVSRQTPAFGSLPGSEGGDFVFELPASGEFLSAQTNQLAPDAIALNGKLDATRPAPATAAGNLEKPVAVVVKDLQGTEQKITPPAAVPTSAKQLAQRANDRGLLLYKEKQYAQAEAQFTEALKLRPDFALAANNLGFVFYKQDKFVEAARWFENTLKIDPSRAVAYLNLGDALAKAGEPGKAKKAFATYLELAPAGPAAAYAKQQAGM